LDPISVETYPPHSTEDELDACSAPPEVTTPTTTLPAGLVEKVKSCGDRLVSMSAQLITNQTSNLAECYMGIQALYDGGKHFNGVQSGSFQTRCYAAALSIQSGPKWQADVMEKTTRATPNQVR
jgi:hypothetical protein